MSEFQPCFDFTIQWEGKRLTSTPGDAGGLTFWGVSRKANPTWPGWGLVGSHLAVCNGDVPQASYLCNHDETLVLMVQRFYKARFLSQRLDEINYQELAIQLFDKAFNMGEAAIMGFQGLLNLTQDGIVGPVTIAAANAYPDASHLVDGFLGWVRLHYQNIAQKNPEDEKFLNGWLNRCRRSDVSFAA